MGKPRKCKFKHPPFPDPPWLWPRYYEAMDMYTAAVVEYGPLPPYHDVCKICGRKVWFDEELHSDNFFDPPWQHYSPTDHEVDPIGIMVKALDDPKYLAK